jgi:predicted nucleic acid-binding protein
MVFVDTSVFCARYARLDAWHGTAVRLWRELEGTSLVTTNHILEESLTLLARRVGYAFAANLASHVYASVELDVIYTTREEEQEALPFFRKFADQRVGFTDCISFAVMRRNGIRTAFTFDRHFVDAGFKVIGLE